MDLGGSGIRSLEQSRLHRAPNPRRSIDDLSDANSEAGSDEGIGVDGPHRDCDATLQTIIDRTIARQHKLELKQTDHPKKAQRIDRLQRRIDDIQRLIDEGYQLVDYIGWYNGKNPRNGKTSEFDTITIKHPTAHESITIELSSRVAYFTHNINTRNFLIRHNDVSGIVANPGLYHRQEFTCGISNNGIKRLCPTETFEKLCTQPAPPKYLEHCNSWLAALNSITPGSPEENPGGIIGTRAKLSPDKVKQSDHPISRLFSGEAITARSADGSWTVDRANGRVKMSVPTGFDGQTFVDAWLDRAIKLSDEVDIDPDIEAHNNQTKINIAAKFFLLGPPDQIWKKLELLGLQGNIREILSALHKVSPERARYCHQYIHQTNGLKNPERAPKIPVDQLHKYDPRTIAEQIFDDWGENLKDGITEAAVSDLLSRMHIANIQGLLSKELTTTKLREKVMALLPPNRQDLIRDDIPESSPAFAEEDLTYYVGKNIMPWHQVVREKDTVKMIMFAMSNAAADDPLVDTGIPMDKDFIESIFDPWDGPNGFEANIYKLDFYRKKIRAHYPGITPEQEKQHLLNLLMTVKQMSVFIDQIGLCCPDCTTKKPPALTPPNVHPTPQIAPSETLSHAPISTTTGDELRLAFGECFQPVITSIYDAFSEVPVSHAVEEETKQAGIDLKRAMALASLHDRFNKLIALDHTMKGIDGATAGMRAKAIAECIEYALWLLDLVNKYEFQEPEETHTIQKHLKSGIKRLSQVLIHELSSAPDYDTDKCRFAHANTLSSVCLTLGQTEFDALFTTIAPEIRSKIVSPQLNESKDPGDAAVIKEARVLSSIPLSSGIKQPTEHPTDAFCHIGAITSSFFAGLLGVGKSTAIDQIKAISSDTIRVLSNTETPSAKFDARKVQPTLLVTAKTAALDDIERLQALARANEDTIDTDEGQSAKCACCAGLKQFLQEVRGIDINGGKTNHLIGDLVGIADDDVLQLYLRQNFARVTVPISFTAIVNLHTQEWDDVYRFIQNPGPEDEPADPTAKILYAQLKVATHVIINNHGKSRAAISKGQFNKILTQARGRDHRTVVQEINVSEPEAIKRWGRDTLLSEHSAQQPQILPESPTNEDFNESELMEGYSQRNYVIDPSDPRKMLALLDNINDPDFIKASIHRAKAWVPFPDQSHFEYQVADHTTTPISRYKENPPSGEDRKVPTSKLLAGAQKAWRDSMHTPRREPHTWEHKPRSVDLQGMHGQFLGSWGMAPGSAAVRAF